MATGPLSIKLRCASWQQLSTIYKRDLSRGTMFLKAASPPPIGTQVRIDLTLPSASVIVLSGVVEQHVTDPQRGSGVELKLAPIPAGSVWMIESALASESKRRNTPAAGVPLASGAVAPTSGGAVIGGQSMPIPSITESEDIVAAEQDLVKALLSEAESLKKLNPFLVLGVGYEATNADVRAAFGELTKRYHPDLYARYESTELRSVAAEIFILIRDAYRKLGDESSRAQVLASLGRAVAPRAVPIQNRPPPVPVKPPRAPTGQVPILPPPPLARPFTDLVQVTSRPGEAPATPPAGRSTPARGVPAVTTPLPAKPATPPKVPSVRESQPIPTMPSASGSQSLRRPPTEDSSPPRATPPRPETAPPPPVQTNRSPVGNAPPVLSGEVGENALEEMLDAGRFEEALAAYKVMAKKNPADRTYRAGIELCEGLRSLAQRDRLEAAQRFEAALEIDPSNERAARELAEMRRLATNERKGLLTRLMGKKDP
ncbi:MAG: DnaJ domain-containing protein [Kofleriaceae bacterium]